MPASSHLAPFVDAQPAERGASLVFWSASIIEADPFTLRDAMARHVPEHAELVRDPVKPHTAMTRAVRRCSSGMPTGYMWRRVGVRGDDLVIAYVREEGDVDGTNGRHYDAGDEFTVTVGKTGGVTCSSASLNSTQQEQYDRLLARYRKERGLLTQEDVTGLLKAILLDEAKGVRVKHGGAVYFIPAPNDDIVPRLAAAIECAGVELVAVPLYDRSTLMQFSESARVSLLDEVEALRREAAQRRAAVVDEGRQMHWSTFERRLLDAQELRNKANLYRDLLAVAVDDIETAIRESEALFKETMLAMTGA